MRAIFAGGHAAVSDFEHVGIVPVARSRELRKAALPEPDRDHAVVIVLDIACGAPKIRAHRLRPSPDPSAAVDAENNGPACAAQGLMHLLESGRILVRLIDITGA